MMQHDYGMTRASRESLRSPVCEEHDVDLARDGSCPSCKLDDQRADSATTRTVIADRLEETLAMLMVQSGDCIDDADASGNGDDATCASDLREMLSVALDYARGRVLRDADTMRVHVDGLRPVYRGGK